MPAIGIPTPLPPTAIEHPPEEPEKEARPEPIVEESLAAAVPEESFEPAMEV